MNEWELYILVNWIAFSIATLFVPMRLYVQLRLYLRPWREIFVILAWLLFLIQCICDSLLLDYNWYNPFMPEGFNWYTGYDPNAPADTYPGSVTERKVGDIATRLYITVYIQIMYCCKAALLCLYHDLVTSRQSFAKIWWALIITDVVVFLTWLNDIINSIIVVFVRWKVPVKVSWEAIWSWSTYGGHIFSDLLIYVLPFFIVHHSLRGTLSREQMIGVYAMFALGFLNVTNAVLQLMAIACPINDQALYVYNLFVTFQPATGIMLVCLPYTRRFFIEVRARWKAAKGPASVSTASPDGVLEKQEPTVQVTSCEGTESQSGDVNNIV